MNPKKVLVTGSGIGGLAVALFLKRSGFDLEIYEAQPAPDDAGGYFLNIASNGLAVLKTLGLDQAVVAEGFPIPHMVMWSGGGKRLVASAFASYERLRRQRAEKMVKASRQFGNNKTAPNAVVRWLRDLMLPFILKASANSQALDWVYTYKVDWDTAIQPPVDH